MDVLSDSLTVTDHAKVTLNLIKVKVYHNGTMHFGCVVVVQ
jgi:hypothetical protein